MKLKDLRKGDETREIFFARNRAIRVERNKLNQVWKEEGRTDGRAIKRLGAA